MLHAAAVGPLTYLELGVVIVERIVVTFAVAIVAAVNTPLASNSAIAAVASTPSAANYATVGRLRRETFRWGSNLPMVSVWNLSTTH